MQIKKTPSELKVNEITCERNNIGELTCFIRLTGCNLKCNRCNEPNALVSGVNMSLKEIIEKVKECPTKKVCVTGGEPLLQIKVVEELVSLLFKEKKDILLETNGTINWTGHAALKLADIKLDLKAPSSGMEKFNNYDLIKTLRRTDKISVVVQDKRDYDFVESILNFYKPVCEVVAIPCGGVYARNLWRWAEKEDRVRLELGLKRVVFGL